MAAIVTAEQSRLGQNRRMEGYRRAAADRKAAAEVALTSGRTCRRCSHECVEYDSGSLVENNYTRVRWTCRCGGDVWQVLPASAASPAEGGRP